MAGRVQRQCPYCGEPIELVFGPEDGDQDYIEDCAVCCRPIAVRLRVDHDGEAQLELRRDDEA
ncbi:CPXCG motif-containing cysteine-rich protein [Pseudoxanthomonas sp. J35]|uniref:CPXCG motif-containing cysteine-rich protein n=1 Tax=Pseudoxanthomonas sp. J35 TaxID=935852 RepID=UPI00048FD826|nr:CPXCG motif-containing cysteine-rich protein [Pseudoxanthomonas sp. J35]